MAVVRSLGDIIVTERSPTHQVCPKKSSNHNAFVISYHCLTNFPCNDELSWLFTSRFRTFYLNCKKIAKSFKISVISILLTFMNLLVNNQLSSFSYSNSSNATIIKKLCKSKKTCQITEWSYGKTLCRSLVICKGFFCMTTLSFDKFFLICKAF